MPTSRHHRTASPNDSAGPTGTTAGPAFDVSTRGGQPAQPAADGALDRALDDALARVRELSLRLWAVREVHQPARGRLGRARCGTCGQTYPCATVQAAGPPALRRTA
jgi:hypothetical protein